MTTFRCGCTDEKWCELHHDYACHNNDGIGTPGECPVCWLARLRSVSLSSSATPTRGRKP